METLTISPKYQVVIPKSIRELLKLRPGQKIHAIVYNNRIELIPVQPIGRLRGFVRGIDAEVEREDDRV
jgi:AbrB family looped-hinge helix DNA binding protein